MRTLPWNDHFITLSVFFLHLQGLSLPGQIDHCRASTPRCVWCSDLERKHASEVYQCGTSDGMVEAKWCGYSMIPVSPRYCLPFSRLLMMHDIKPSRDWGDVDLLWHIGRELFPQNVCSRSLEGQAIEVCLEPVLHPRNVLQEDCTPII